MTRRERKRPFTQAEIEHIQDLHGQGLSYAIISERVGRSAGCLSTKMSQLKHGHGALYSVEKWAERSNRIVELFQKGVTLTELSKMYSISLPGIAGILTRQGLDAEMRQQVRKEIKMSEGMN